MILNRNVLFISLLDLNIFLLWLHFQLFGFGHSSLKLGHNFGLPLPLYPSTYISYELIWLTLYLPWLKHARAVKLSKTVLSHNVYYWSATPILLFIKIIVFLYSHFTRPPKHYHLFNTHLLSSLCASLFSIFHLLPNILLRTSSQISPPSHKIYLLTWFAFFCHIKYLTLVPTSSVHA